MLPVPDQPTQLSRADQLLLHGLQADRPDAVSRIQDAYGQELLLFCRRMLGDAAAAEDALQDVWAKCCAIESAALPTSSLRGWLYQLARNRCIDLLRRRRASQPIGPAADSSPTHAGIDPTDPLTTPAGKALKRDRAVRIFALLDRMDDDLRSVVVMKFFQDLSREEIADAIGLTVAGTKARLSKAMEWLREQLADDGGSTSS